MIINLSPSVGHSLQPLCNLTLMDLSHSRNLIKMPNFREIPNLEWLDLEGCIKLVQIDPSIGVLRKLASLNLKNCTNLVSIPNNIFGLSSLRHLNLSGCPKLLNNQLLEKQRQVEQLEKLDKQENTTQSQSTSSIYKVLMTPFRFLHFRKHEDSVGQLLPYLSRLSCLQYLDLSFCNLLLIPNAIGWLHSLVNLNLGGNNFVSLPSSIRELSKLRVLNLEHCKQLKYLPELPSSTVLPVRRTDTGLYIFNCPNLSEMECCYGIAFSWMIQLLEVPTPSFPLSNIFSFRHFLCV